MSLELIEKEDDVSKSESNLKKEIARLSFVAASKLPFAKEELRADILAAMNLYTQAMILAEDDEFTSEARRHLSLARRLSR